MQGLIKELELNNILKFKTFSYNKYVVYCLYTDTERIINDEIDIYIDCDLKNEIQNVMDLLYFMFYDIKDIPCHMYIVKQKTPIDFDKLRNFGIKKCYVIDERLDVYDRFCELLVTYFNGQDTNES